MRLRGNPQVIPKCGASGPNWRRLDFQDISYYLAKGRLAIGEIDRFQGIA